MFEKNILKYFKLVYKSYNQCPSQSTSVFTIYPLEYEGNRLNHPTLVFSKITFFELSCFFSIGGGGPRDRHHILWTNEQCQISLGNCPTAAPTPTQTAPDLGFMRGILQLHPVTCQKTKSLGKCNYFMSGFSLVCTSDTSQVTQLLHTTQRHLTISVHNPTTISPMVYLQLVSQVKLPSHDSSWVVYDSLISLLRVWTSR